MRSSRWLYRYVAEHGGSFDARHSKWATEQKIEHDTAGYHIHDMLGCALDLALTFDQLDTPNIAAMEMVGRCYQLVEQTSGTMRVEGIEHYKGRDVSGSGRRGTALSPQLAKHTVGQMAAQTEILKQRRKAREESEATKSKKK